MRLKGMLLKHYPREAKKTVQERLAGKGQYKP